MSDIINTAQFTLTEDDMADASDLYIRTNLMNWRAIVAMVLCVGGIMTAMAYISDKEIGPFDLITFFVFAPIGCLIGLWLYRFAARGGARKQLREFKALAAPTTISWTPDSIRFDREGAYEDMPWADVHKFAVNEHMLQLYRTSRLYIPIPMRALSPAQRDSLIEAVERARSKTR
ncbi:YcxB family protein [Terrihabitans sp. B22-R8]|uniref:YcxB family protein n=1 Tax=Terrihabitans sp. B22-R8 TaxID=3425128 RepID=UPI00403CAF49